MLHELVPLSSKDCFTLFYREKDKFSFPLHFHEEFELNFISNAKGAKRKIGDHEGVIEDLEMALIGPNLPHGWFNYKNCSEKITEITIQFHPSFLDQNLLGKNQFHSINEMLEVSYSGILFSKQTTMANAERIINLKEKRGFESVIELLNLLQELSISKGMSILSNTHQNEKVLSADNGRIQIALSYMEKNFSRKISLNEVANLTHMTNESFSRFFRHVTGRSFIQVLNEIRIRKACRNLINTELPINEIALDCGFNNISNFNRIFKKNKNCTPKQYRGSHTPERIFI